MVKDNTAHGVTPRSSEAWEGRSSVNTCPIGASEKSISIYAKSRCQWISRSIDWSSNHKDMALGTTAADKAPRGSSGLPKEKCVLEVP